jgi:hypothetical protein
MKDENHQHRPSALTLLPNTLVYINDPLEVDVAGVRSTFPGLEMLGKIHVVEETGSPQSLTAFNPDLSRCDRRSGARGAGGAVQGLRLNSPRFRHPFSLILSTFLRVPANPLWQCTKAHQADYRL